MVHEGRPKCGQKFLVVLSAISLATVLSACSAQSMAEGAAKVTDDIDQAAAERGRIFAQDNCATCHAIGPGSDQSPNPNAPAFESIAVRPEMTRAGLNAWLHSEHPSMPLKWVHPNELRDLIEYLAALRRGKMRCDKDSSAYPCKT